MIGILVLASCLVSSPESEAPPEEGTGDRRSRSIEASAKPTNAEEAPPSQTTTAPREPFAFDWSASFDAGFPLNGLALGRTIRRRWLVRAGFGMGYPFPVLAAGATASVSRGFALGRVATLAPGLVVDGFSTRFCSAGGCGDRHRYLGVGPTVALHLYAPSVERVWLGFGVGAGVTYSVVRERMRLVQPHVQVLSVTVGWPHRRER